MCVLGLCALMDLDQRPQAVNQVAGQLLPAAILLFNGLKRAYTCRAEHENDEDEEEGDGEEEEENGKWALPNQKVFYLCSGSISVFWIKSSFMVLFHCMVRYGTVRFTLGRGFHWVQCLVLFSVPTRLRFQANRTVTKTWRVLSLRTCDMRHSGKAPIDIGCINI